MKIEKISKTALYICIGVILVCFALFLTIGYDNPVGDYNEPKLTDLIMWLMYIMAIVTALLICWSAVKSLQNSKGVNHAAIRGVPGGKITVCTLLLLIASLVIGFVSGIGEPDFTASDGTVTTGSWVTVVDMFCVSIGIMFVAAIVAVGVSMTGLVSKTASK
ncbi:MAG: hypothetical protein IJR87_13015 [Bacteroidaceae bacterium]|nr:hypothetical protein [Bacteroidaceae bacterium]